MGGLIFFAAIVLWISFCVWIVRRFVRWLPLKSRWQKVPVGALSFVVLFFLPLIDEIIGKIQFDKLCREEAGVKIYGKLALGPEFFNADGTPSVTFPRTVNIRKDLLEYVEIVNPPSRELFSIAHISKKQYQIRSKSDGRVLLEVTSFGLHGGWLAYDRHPWLFPPGCGDSPRLDEIIKRVIVKKN